MNWNGDLMRYISARERNIIVDLTNPNLDASYLSLSNRYHCSVRTIRRDLIAIESLLSVYNLVLNIVDETIEINGPKEKIDQMLSEMTIYEYSEIERLIIIFDQLTNVDEYIKYYVLLSKLQLSQSILTKDLDELDKRIKPYQGSIERKRSAGIKLDLKETGIRRVLHGLLLEYVSMFNFVSLFEGASIGEMINPDMHETIKRLISMDKFSYYMHEIKQTILDFKLTIDDSTMIQAALYLLIIDKRNGKIQEEQTLAIFDERITEFVNKFPFKAKDLNDLGDFLSSSLSYDLIVNYDYQTLALIDQFVDRLIDKAKISKKLKKAIYVDVLSWHQRTFNQTRDFGVYQSYGDGISEEYPLLSEILQTLIFDTFGTHISNYDVTDLMMYLVAHIENEQSKHTLSVLVVCIGGMGSSRMIVTRLKNKFSNLTLKNISLAELPLQEKDSYDFVISTVSVSLENYDVIKVSPLLFDKDIRLINQKVRQYTENRKLKEKSHLEYSTELATDQVDQKTLQKLLENVLGKIKDEYLDMKIEDAIKMFLAYEALGFGIPETNIAIYHIRSRNVKKQLLSFVYSLEPIEVLSMTNEPMKASIHIVMMSTEDMTPSEKQLFNTVSILVTRDPKFQKILESKILSNIQKYIEKEMA
jgi:mannitol operon transcriptional antiterminator